MAAAAAAASSDVALLTDVVKEAAMDIQTWNKYVLTIAQAEDDVTGKAVQFLADLPTFADQLPREVYRHLVFLYKEGIRAGKRKIVLFDSDAGELTLFLERRPDAELAAGLSVADIATNYELSETLQLFVSRFDTDIFDRAPLVEEAIFNEFVKIVSAFLSPEDIAEATAKCPEGHLGDRFLFMSSIGNALRVKFALKPRVRSSDMQRLVWSFGLETDADPSRVAKQIIYTSICNAPEVWEKIEKGEPEPPINSLLTKKKIEVPSMSIGDMRMQMALSWYDYARQFLEAACDVWTKCPVLKEWQTTFAAETSHIYEESFEGDRQRKNLAEMVLQYHEIMSDYYTAIQDNDDRFIMTAKNPEFARLSVAHKWTVATSDVREACFDYLRFLNQYANCFSLYMVCPDGMFNTVIDFAKDLMTKFHTGQVSLKEIMKGGLMRYGEEVLARTSAEDKAMFMESIRNGEAADSMVDLMSTMFNQLKTQGMS